MTPPARRVSCRAFFFPFGRFPLFDRPDVAPPFALVLKETSFRPTLRPILLARSFSSFQREAEPPFCHSIRERIMNGAIPVRDFLEFPRKLPPPVFSFLFEKALLLEKWTLSAERRTLSSVREELSPFPLPRRRFSTSVPPQRRPTTPQVCRSRAKRHTSSSERLFSA